MSYANSDDLRLLLSEKELVQLASDGRSRSWDEDRVQAVLTEAIDQADGEIDGYIGMAVELPLVTVPRVVENISAKIAVYNLLRRRPSVPDHWQSEYRRCLAMLEKIAEGKLSLGQSDDTGSPVESDHGAGIVTRPSRY